jgi:predicted RNA binding protein YcfA (HicA-like mRNA interferase family)
VSGQLPALRAKVVIAALERAGFVVDRVSGSHYILRHPGRAGLRVTIAWHGKDLKPKTLRAIIKQAGLTEAEFLRLL